MRQLTFHSTTGETITANIRNEWQDITTAEFIAMQGASEIEATAILTGLTVDQLKALTEPALAVISGLMEDMEPLPLQDYPIDIEDLSIRQLEEAKVYAANGLKGIADVYGVYKPEELNPLTESVSKVLPFALFIFRELERIAEKYAGLNQSEYSDDEIDAGVEGFADFGFYSTMDALAGGDILKHDEVMQLSVRQVFTKLVYDKKVNDYQKELTELRQANQK